MLKLTDGWQRAVGVDGLAARPLRQRRWMLRAMFSARGFVRPPTPVGVSEIFRRALALPETSAVRLEHELIFHDRLLLLEWKALNVGNPASFQSDVLHVDIDDEPLLAHVARSGRSVVLAPLHMGNYPLSLGAVIQRHFADREIVVLRARDDLHMQTFAMQRFSEISRGVTIINTKSKEDFVKLAKFGRRGAVAICFIDLPEDYGTATDVTLFRAKARMAFGAARLARLMDGVLLPLAVTSSLNGDRVLTGSAFEVSAMKEGDETRLHQALGRQIQDFISQEPSQWHMWPRINEYFPAAPREEVVHAE